MSGLVEQPYGGNGPTAVTKRRRRANFAIGRPQPDVPLPAKSASQRLSVALSGLQAGFSIPVEGYSVATVRRTAKDVWPDKGFAVDTDEDGKLRIWRI